LSGLRKPLDAFVKSVDSLERSLHRLVQFSDLSAHFPDFRLGILPFVARFRQPAVARFDGLPQNFGPLVERYLRPL
jgi:hypothetical protein